MLLACLAAPAAAAVAPAEGRLVPQPTDVAAAVDGAPAVFVDAALAGMRPGASLVWRRAGRPGVSGWGANALAGAASAGPVALGLGIGRAQAFGAGAHEWRAVLSAGSPQLRLGGALRVLSPAAGSPWVAADLSLAGAPVRQLRASVGIDAVGAPAAAVGNASMPRTVRAGLAWMPVPAWGPSVLAAEVRWPIATARPHVGALWSQPIAAGWSAFVAGGVGQAWDVAVGLRAALGPADLELSGLAAGSHAPRSAGERMFAQAQVSSRPLAPRIGERPRTISVSVATELRPARGWPWGHALRAPLCWRLRQWARPAARVARVVLEVPEPLAVGLATIESLQSAVHELRRHGVEVIGRTAEADARTYLLLAACSRIEMDPMGQLDLSGFASHKRFYAAALERLGIRLRAVRAGSFKTGADGWTRDGPRPQEADNRQPLLDAAQAALAQALGGERQLAAAQAQAALDMGLLEAADAKRLGLVDALAPELDVARRQVGRMPAWSSPPPARRPPGFAAAPTVVVVPVRGLLGSAAAGGWLGEAVDVDAVERQLAAAAGRPEVKGVVLAIDSPGGDVVASERLWRAARRLAAVKPVAASLGDVAASGGYYVAVAADRLFAAAHTVTGSIGVYRLALDVSPALARLGIVTDARRAGPHAGWQSPWQPLAEEDEAMLARSIDAAYAQFWARVAAGRSLPDGARAELAEGRVWSGSAALERGLVDALGDEASAIDWLAARAKVPADALSVEVAGRVGWSPWSEALGAMGANGQAPLTPAQLLSRWQGLQASRGLALFWPEDDGL